MRDFFDGKVIGLRWKLQSYLRELAEKEDGDTNFVSIIVIIVIILAVATVFRDQLKLAIEKVMGNFTSFIDNTK